MQNLYDIRAPKETTQLQINGDLLDKANKMNINLAAELESALALILQDKEQQQWLEQNEEAILNYFRFSEQQA